MENHKPKHNSLTIILGGLTLIIFASRPFILDLIEPTKSIGQAVGETAKDMLDIISGDKKSIGNAITKRETWSNILSIAGLILFTSTFIISAIGNNFETKKILIAAGPILAIIGLIFFIYYFSLSIVATIVVAVLALFLVIGFLYLT